MTQKLKNAGTALGLNAEQLKVMPMQMAYAHQGFLGRLDMSLHAERFVVKGGASLFARFRELGRPTRDLDLASPGPPASAEEVKAWIVDICQQPFGDLLEFPVDEIQVGQMTPETAAPPVVSVRLTAVLGKSRQRVDLDVSFGSVIHPGTCVLTYPQLVIPEAVQLRAYPLEQIVAEKFAAMIELNVGNTRMKDFHDLWQIARYDPPEPVPGESARGMRAADLGEAMARSFAVRQTPLADLPYVLSGAFAQDEEILEEWQRYWRRNAWAQLPEFAAVMASVRVFPGEVAQSLPLKTDGIWNPGTQRWE